MNSLNRDPKRVIFIDWNKDSVGLAMNNALILPKWEGDNSDTSLIGLSHLLQGTVNGFRIVIPFKFFNANKRIYFNVFLVGPLKGPKSLYAPRILTEIQSKFRPEFRSQKQHDLPKLFCET